MAGVALGLRIVLALVLLAAGAGKLADRQGARAAVTGFGVPEALARPVAAGLPWLELTAAILLVPSATAPVGAVLALAMMLVFCAAISRSLVRGEAPECHCFGALHSAPAGPRTLARNLALAAAATAVVAAGPGTSATAWIGGWSGGWPVVLGLGLALTAALASAGAFALKLLRRNGELLLRIDALEHALVSGTLALPAQPQPPAPIAGLPIGATAPEFGLPALDGEPATLAALRARGGDLLLVFTDPGCGPCSTLAPQLASWQREAPGGLRPVLISRGAPEANLAHAREHGLADIYIQADREVAESFAVSGTPSAVIIAADGTVASAVHTGEEEIRSLVAGREPRVVLPVHRSTAATGQAAPDPALRTPDGEIVRLSQRLPDSEALLVFWNPDCGFCERMLESLRELDARVGGLVVISTGSPAASAAMALRAPILLDDAYATGNAFGATGTPSAVRLDADRRVASAVAVGADAILALAGAEPAVVPA